VRESVLLGLAGTKVAASAPNEMSGTEISACHAAFKATHAASLIKLTSFALPIRFFRKYRTASDSNRARADTITKTRTLMFWPSA
jgi:hypothetical protein